MTFRAWLVLLPVAAYPDNIILTSGNTEDHVSHLYKIREPEFQIPVDKCSFFLISIKHLVNFIDRNGRQPESGIFRALKKMPPPTRV